MFTFMFYKTLIVYTTEKWVFTMLVIFDQIAHFDNLDEF